MAHARNFPTASPLPGDLLRAGCGRTAAAGQDFSRIPTHSRDPGQPLAGLIGGSPDERPDRLRTPAATDSGPERDPAAAEPRRTGGDSAQPADDSPQLSKTTMIGPTEKGCGDFEWAIAWNLSKAAPKGGYVVQELTTCLDTQSCAEGAQPFHLEIHYWEGWPISKGQTVTTVVQRGVPADDWFGRHPTAEMRKSNGEIRYTGEARYYDGVDVMAHGFVITGKAPTFGLPVTQTDPGLSGGSNAVTHNLTASWDCCATGEGASTATKLVTE